MFSFVTFRVVFLNWNVPTIETRIWLFFRFDFQNEKTGLPNKPYTLILKIFL